MSKISACRGSRRETTDKVIVRASICDNPPRPEIRSATKVRRIAPIPHFSKSPKRLNVIVMVGSLAPNACKAPSGIDSAICFHMYSRMHLTANLCWQYASRVVVRTLIKRGSTQYG